MTITGLQPLASPPLKRDADYIFYELTRSICPECRRVIDAQILLRAGKVYMRKRCPEHGQFEALIYGDAQAYTRLSGFNKPGTIPLAFTTTLDQGCPHDCGLCPDHQQHACLGIIEVNSACNMACPLCFADAGAGFNLTLAEVEAILDHFVATEGNPEVVQFSGGEPSIHPDIIAMLRAAKARNIRHVMLNTNGKRIANDDAFLAELADVHPAIYFQFDGFDAETYRLLRGESNILSEKLRGLDRLAQAGLSAVLVPAIERGVNEHEV
ncbi:MAG: radical SAM protein, partial [Chloroflexi bacterium SZAS-1]|nr:radical SAM protein [Chloroflexi bacterium SZAS-1]